VLFFIVSLQCTFCKSAQEHDLVPVFVAVEGLAVGVQSSTTTCVFTPFQSQKWELYTV